MNARIGIKRILSLPQALHAPVHRVKLHLPICLSILLQLFGCASNAPDKKFVADLQAKYACLQARPIPGPSYSDAVIDENLRNLDHHLTIISCSAQDQLTETYSRALKKGFACLKQYRPEDVQEITRFFVESSHGLPFLACSAPANTLDIDGNQFKLLDKSSAEAFCGGHGNPGIILNSLTWDQTDENARAAMLFHETEHWLGYHHFNGFDYAYLTELCCLGKDAQSQAKACKLLRSKPEWTSEAYSKQFAQLMGPTGRYYITARTSWSSIFLIPRLTGKKNNRVNALNLFWSAYYTGAYAKLQDKNKIAQWRRNGQPLFASILGEASLENVPDELEPTLRNQFSRDVEEKFYPPSEFADSPVRKIQKAMSGIFSGILNDDLVQVEANWNSLQAISPAACPLLSASEQRVIGELLFMADAKLQDSHVSPSLKAAWNTPVCGTQTASPDLH